MQFKPSLVAFSLSLSLYSSICVSLLSISWACLHEFDMNIHMPMAVAAIVLSTESWDTVICQQSLSSNSHSMSSGLSISISSSLNEYCCHCVVVRILAGFHAYMSTQIMMTVIGSQCKQSGHRSVHKIHP